MTDIEFERLLLYTPRTGEAQFKRVDIRTILYCYFKQMGFSDEISDKHVKDYTDELFKMFVNRKM